MFIMSLSFCVCRLLALDLLCPVDRVEIWHLLFSSRVFDFSVPNFRVLCECFYCIRVSGDRELVLSSWVRALNSLLPFQDGT